MHFSTADGAPGLEKLVDDLAVEFAGIEGKLVPVGMGEGNRDWDILYPFSTVRCSPVPLSKLAADGILVCGT